MVSLASLPRWPPPPSLVNALLVRSWGRAALGEEGRCNQWIAGKSLPGNEEEEGGGGRPLLNDGSEQNRNRQRRRERVDHDEMIERRDRWEDEG